MPQRNYSRERTDVAKPNKRVILPVELAAYQELSSDCAQFRAGLDKMIEQYPELFPLEIGEGNATTVTGTGGQLVSDGWKSSARR